MDNADSKPEEPATNGLNGLLDGLKEASPEKRENLTYEEELCLRLEEEARYQKQKLLVDFPWKSSLFHLSKRNLIHNIC